MPETPPLRALDDPAAIRSDIYSKVLDEFDKLPPLVGPKHTLRLSDVSYADPAERSTAERKQAILTGKTLDRRVRGTWELIDNADNKVVDKRQQTIARVPHLTNAGTFVLNGVENVLRSQLRLQPGVFARIRSNGEIESHANVLKGISHRLALDPEQGIFRMEIGQARLPLLPVLRALGATDKDLRTAWGPELLAANERHGHGEQTIDKLYDRLVKNADPAATSETRHQAVATALQAMELDPDVTERTLGERHANISQHSILAATRKLLAVSRGEAEPDDRDHPAYQNFLGPEDLFAERVRNAHRTLRPLLWRASNRGNLDPVLPGVLTKAVTGAITESGLGQALEEVSPLDILNQFIGVSRMGTGGIPNIEAIPAESRNVNPAQFGYVDYLVTPESLRAGVDSKLASGAMRGKDGRLYAPYLDPRTGKTAYRSPQDVANLTIAFPGELQSGRKHVDALVKGRLGKVRRRDVDLVVPHMEPTLSPTANLIPMKSGAKGQRGSMGSRFLAQALPLEHGEAPLVQAAMPGTDKSYDEHYGRWMGAVHAAKAGRVSKVGPEEIVIKHDDGTQQVYDLANQLPLNRKTFLHQTPMVAAGDRVEPEQLLARSNFTNDKGVTALGLNARVAFIPDTKNFEDAYTISESFARKATSHHAYQHEQEWDDNIRRGKHAFLSLFPGKFDKQTLATLDHEGIVQPGTIVKHGDPLVLVARERQRAHNQVTRAKAASFQDQTLLWEHHAPGVVTDAVKTPKGVTVVVKSLSQMQEGDKLANRYGGKGLVKIVPDDQMPHDSQGRPFEVLSNPLGVQTRGNPAQVIETVLGKIAAITGKPYKVQDFGNINDLTEFAANELRKHGQTDMETITDPVSGRKIPNVLTGVQYFMKLHHLAESKAQGRDIGGYTAEQTPARGGGDGSSKRLSLGDVLALLSHGATHTIRDAKLYKGQQNFDLWASFMAGRGIPQPQVPFTWHKFTEQLKAAGVNPVPTSTGTQLFAVTDRDVDKMAGDRELEHTGTVNWKEGLKELPGGLFSPDLTGGHGGKRWSKITLAEPMVNPIFEEATRRLLDLTEKQFRQIVAGRGDLGGQTGPKAIEQALGNINVEQALNTAKAQVASGHKSQRDDAVRRWGILQNLQDQGLTPKDWVLHKVPVLPPAYRPVSIMAGSGSPLVSDPNYLYSELFEANQNLKTMQQQSADLGPERVALYDAFKAVTGLGEPIGKKNQDSGVRGILQHVFGCYDDTTEILTKSGWLLFKDLSDGVEVFTLSPVTGAGEWQLPSEIQHYRYIGELVRLQHGLNLDMLITPNHRNWIRKRRKSRSQDEMEDGWEFEYAYQTVVSTDTGRRWLRTAPSGWKGHCERPEFLPTSCQLEVFAAYVGWWLAEGFIGTGGHRNRVSVCQSDKHIEYCADIEKVLVGLGLPYRKNKLKKPDGSYMLVWQITSAELARWLELHCGRGSAGKFLSRYLLDWDMPYLTNLWYSYLCGDGGRVERQPGDGGITHRNNTKTVPFGLFTTVSRLLCDGLVEIGAKLGYTVRVRRMINGDKSRRDRWIAGISGSRFMVTDGCDGKSFEWYDGYVHCCTVPNGIVYVRRNGKPVFSGNSGSPKFSTVQRSLLSGTVDLVGRGAVVPSADLDMDQVGIPEDKAWEVYRPFIVRRLVRHGVTPLLAIRQAKERTPLAREQLVKEMDERPVILTRAPTLHRYNVMAFWPQLVPGNAIQTNPFINKGFNLDHDGDCKSLRTNDLWLLDGKPYFGPLADLVKLLSPEWPALSQAIFKVMPGKLFVPSYEGGNVVFLPVSHVHFHTRHEATMRVKLISGFALNTTEDHGLMTFATDMTMCRVTPREVIGGILPVIRRLPVPELYIRTLIAPDHELTLDYSLGYLTGHYLGDGGAYDKPKQVRFTAIEPGALEALLQHIENTGWSCKAMNSRRGCRGYHVDDLEIYEWFRAEFGVGSRCKRLPAWTYTTPQQFRAGILDGLLSTDGAVNTSSGRKRNGSSVWIHLFNPDLIASIATLLRTLGICCSVSCPDKTDSLPRRVSIPIGEMAGYRISHPRRMCQLKTAMENSTPTRGYLQVVPWTRDLRARLQQYTGASKEKEVGFADVYVKKGHMSLVKARQMMETWKLGECIDEVVRRWVTWVLSDQIVWVPVESVTECDREAVMFDVTVPGPHLTACPDSGLLTHQTMNFHVPFTPEAVDEAKEKLLPSKNLLAVKTGKVHQLPTNEFSAGLYLASTLENKRKPERVFATRKDALHAYEHGQLDAGDRVVIMGD